MARWLRRRAAHAVRKRLSGKRRNGRRPDAEQSFGSLRVLTDTDTRKQDTLGDVTRRLAAVARDEQEALDHRVAELFGEPASVEPDNPFSPAYLLDAIGMTSRALYPDPQIWRSVMERVVTDFIPAIPKIYIPLNRLLAERGVLPEIAAMLRARSELHPADDDEVLPLFDRLMNDVHPSMQAWRTLDRARRRGSPLCRRRRCIRTRTPRQASARRTRATAAVPEPTAFRRSMRMLARRELARCSDCSTAGSATIRWRVTCGRWGRPASTPA